MVDGSLLKHNPEQFGFGFISPDIGRCCAVILIIQLLLISRISQSIRESKKAFSAKGKSGLSTLRISVQASKGRL